MVIMEGVNSMDRNIGLERVFSLGDYKSLRVSDYSNNIPEELALDEEFIAKLRHLQLVSVDRAYYDYRVMAGELNTLEEDKEKAQFLAEMETNLYTILVGRMTKTIGETESK